MNPHNELCIKENLELYKDIPPTSCEHYKDVSTGTLFVHCFKKGVPLDEDFIEVYEIFQRRIKRFRSKIKQSKKILLVYVSNIDLYTDEDLVLKTEKISDILTKKYSGILSRKKHIDLLYILPVNSQVFKEKYLSENVKKIEMQYKDKYSTPNTEWKGIPELFNKTFSQVKLSKQIAYKKKFFELLIKLIPFKKLREKWGAL